MFAVNVGSSGGRGSGQAGKILVQTFFCFFGPKQNSSKGNFNGESDIDLAVVMNNLSNSYTMQVKLMKISRKFDTRIEPHPFDETDFDTSHPFAHEILTTGVQIL